MLEAEVRLSLPPALTPSRTVVTRPPNPALGLPSASCGPPKAIFIGGGNTFRLLRQLRAHGLLEPIRKRVLEEGVPYLGISAGSVVAGPNIKTTNDMPIVELDSFASLGLVDFQVNARHRH